MKPWSDARRRWFFLSVFACLLIAFAAGARAARSPTSVADRLQARFALVTDYECVMRTETRAGTRVEAATFRTWYRKPDLFRLRVLKGRHQGSELVRGTDGSLRGRRGGLLRPFSRRLSRSDPSLRSLRGQPAWELDLGSFLRAMRRRMALPGSLSTVKEPGPDGRDLTLEVQYKAPEGDHSLRDVWSIDPQSWLLVSGDVYDDTQRVDHFEISDLRLDRGLTESWFHF
jgi:outer membrane lipoprotein-sorting protein